MVETKFNELRYKTSDPERMINKYLVSRVCRTWAEDFVDEDTGKLIPVEHNEVIFDRGLLITADMISEIQFFMQVGELKEVEVSNQKRLAYELENNYFQPYLAQVEIDRKKVKFLFHATNMDVGKDILKDYIELNYSFPFHITMLKEYDDCIILIDDLSDMKSDEEYDAYESPEVAEEDKKEREKDRKFYQIECKVRFSSDNGEGETTKDFVVHTLNTERALMKINEYLKVKEQERKINAKENDYSYFEQTYYPMIESAKTIPVGCFIPREFSDVYTNKQ